jgi:hypothetical protein
MKQKVMRVVVAAWGHYNDAEWSHSLFREVRGISTISSVLLRPIRMLTPSRCCGADFNRLQTPSGGCRRVQTRRSFAKSLLHHLHDS